MVCSKHFTKDCFMEATGGLVVLKRGSVPTIFSWNQKTQSRNVLGWPAERIYLDHAYAVRDLSQPFLVCHFQCDPEMIRFYTGFKDYDTLKAVFVALQPFDERMTQWSQVQMVNTSEEATHGVGFGAEQLPLFDQFFMFLCHVRQGIREQDLAVRFRVSQSTVSRNCITWANYLFIMLGSLPIWPSRSTVDELMPTYFTATFPKTRVFLDCAEIRVQTASSKVCNSQTHSHHKGIAVFKSLIGMTPSGSVSFVSRLYTGRISDQAIIKQSGILGLLEEGDEVMVTESILIRELPTDLNVTLATPPYLDPSGQFGEEGSTCTPELGDLRAHIQRCISRIKEYRIFDGVVPLTLAGSVNEIWTVCALLTHFCEPLE